MSGPRGVLWRWSAPLTRGSRQKRFDMFMRLLEPTPETRVLDVGVTDADWRSSNFFEAQYPWPRHITAVAPAILPAFARAHPDVPFVLADGRSLPFRDDAFDVGFSNAVIEHVGSRDDQMRFVHEMVRTCRRVFIATPNARFPVDPHTLLPFVHWLPRRVREPILRWTRNGRWASEEALNPLNASDFLNLFPTEAEVRLLRQRMAGLTSVLVAVASRAQPDKPPQSVTPHPPS